MIATPCLLRQLQSEILLPDGSMALGAYAPVLRHRVGQIATNRPGILRIDRNTSASSDSRYGMGLLSRQ